MSEQVRSGNQCFFSIIFNLVIHELVFFVCYFDYFSTHSATYDALVVKASGLAAGKGVIVANNREEACAAVDEILGEKKYGSAGSKIVVEEKLSGEEVSVRKYETDYSFQISQSFFIILGKEKWSLRFFHN